MSDVRVSFNAEWQELVNNCQRQLAPAMRKGLGRAGAAALQNVEAHWRPGGGVPAWATYSPAYAARKMAGMVEPGRQVSTSGQPDNILTGALKQAAVFVPLAHWPNSWTLVIMPRGELQRSRKGPVKDYMDAVYARRPFYGMTPADEMDVAEQFALGFINALKGVPDPVGRHLGGG